jgi:hypothetical protein
MEWVLFQLINSSNAVPSKLFSLDIQQCMSSVSTGGENLNWTHLITRGGTQRKRDVFGSQTILYRSRYSSHIMELSQNYNQTTSYSRSQTQVRDESHMLVNHALCQCDQHCSLYLYHTVPQPICSWAVLVVSSQTFGLLQEFWMHHLLQLVMPTIG